MQIYPMLAVLIVCGNFVGYVRSTLVISRTWHEEFKIRQEREKENGHSHKVSLVLYPRFKICVGPREKAEKLKQKSVQVHTKSTESVWSDLLGIYTADSGAEIHNWYFWKHKIDPTKATRWNQFLAILVFVGLFVAIFVIFVFLVPLVGKFGFAFYSLLWLVIFHPEMRRMLRRLLITKEKISRKHIHLFMKSGDKSKQSKKPFRLPFVLREYEEEEIPAELILSEEESDGDVSSDGFENLLVTKGKKAENEKTKGFTTESKALRYFMATTEQELDNSQNVDKTA